MAEIEPENTVNLINKLINKHIKKLVNKIKQKIEKNKEKNSEFDDSELLKEISEIKSINKEDVTKYLLIYIYKLDLNDKDIPDDKKPSDISKIKYFIENKKLLKDLTDNLWKPSKY